jgi:DNA gyrase, B subunit
MVDEKKKYDDSSINLLEGEMRIRTRPESMLGSNGLDGAKHTVIEILGNATDEHLSGYGDKLDITLFEDGSIGIRDYGRGVPMGWNEKYNKWNYYLIYEELYAGSKYDDNQEVLRSITDWSNFDFRDYPYLITVGLNGVGAAATQGTSEFCRVESYRDGVMTAMDYETGRHCYEEPIVEATNEPNGTFVRWKPDGRPKPLGVFSDVKIPERWFRDLAYNQSFIGGFDVTYNNQGNIIQFPKKTLLEALKEELGSDSCAYGKHFAHAVEDGEICVCEVEVAIGEKGQGTRFFHNKVAIRGGVHADALNTAEWQFFKDRGAERGVKIKTVDYAGSLSVLVSSLSNKVSYRGQTKDSLDNRYVFDCVEASITELLENEWAKGTPWLVEIVESVIEAAENRLAVDEMSKQLKSIAKAVKSQKASDKFKSCKTYGVDPARTEYFIVEGDSAGNAVKNGRDPVFQCLQKLKGKSLNLYKASIEKMLKNKEIADIVASIGCGIELNIEGYKTFDINSLKVGKIIFETDADIDGKHIRMLLFLIFWKLMPQLLYDGYVYIGETPLYIVNKVDGTSLFCYTEEELRDLQESDVAIQNITRFKGLGEMNSEDLWNTTLNPETRKLTQIKISPNDLEIDSVLEILFGKSTDLRKKEILGTLIGDEYAEQCETLDELMGYIASLDMEDGLDVEEIEYVG